MKDCLNRCGRQFPEPALKRAAKKKFCSDGCKAEFHAKARKIGQARLRRKLERKTVKGIKKNATPAQRLDALAAMAREVLR